MTNLSLNLPSITLPLHSLPCPIQLYHSQPPSISLLTTTQVTFHHNRYPPITYIQPHLPLTLPLPYHPPSATHHTVVLPTILKR
ncbi:CDA_G0043660.mRNA.1.CDS.1 [Saccharomyces cerevisiae]|nr:CDA_G0043660.mRNA.1.CDS.1 [Saccharomyces cerevisiae]CAI7436388.1 CDA_G0043660.mRNA.1.CDS.1 [Saccharomyces cerevisiae]